MIKTTTFLDSLKLLTDLGYKHGLDASVYEEKLSRFLLFTTQNFVAFHQPEHLHQLLDSFGFMPLIHKCPNIIRVFEVLILGEFIRRNSIDVSFYDRMLLNGNTCQKLTTADKTYKTAEGTTSSGHVGLPMAASAGRGSTETYVNNFQVAPTFDIVYWTGQAELDNYIKWSLIFHYNLSVFDKMTQFQRLIMLTLCNYLVKKGDYIRNMYRKLTGTRYRRDNQPILGDYLENFENCNLTGYKMMAKYNLKPFLLELNGKPGIGKSDFVDFLASFMHELFPFYEASDMLYSRVNDKYWNGYKQQPIVLFDDQNQNARLKYDLDNEIIALGSGKFVHPPMAFDKDTKFSSIFVVFTTNKRIIHTTRADKGAIDRRLNVRVCEPLSELGAYAPCEFGGEKWIYKNNVEFHPFNLQLNGQSFMVTLFDFISNLYKQRSLQFSTRKLFYYLNSFVTSIDNPSFEDLLNLQFEEIEVQKVEACPLLEQKVYFAGSCEKSPSMVPLICKISRDVSDDVRKLDATGMFTSGGAWRSVFSACSNLIGLKSLACQFSQELTFIWQSSTSIQNEICMGHGEIRVSVLYKENDKYVLARMWVYNYLTRTFYKSAHLMEETSESLLAGEILRVFDIIMPLIAEYGWRFHEATASKILLSNCGYRTIYRNLRR